MPTEKRFHKNITKSLQQNERITKLCLYVREVYKIKYNFYFYNVLLFINKS